MANENKEIGDIVKKCKILLLDIEGTTTSISFVKDKLFPYAEENVKKFLDAQWETEDVKDVVSALRKLAIEDKESSVEGVVTIPGEDATKDEQIQGLVSSVKWQMSADRKAGALKQLQGLIWKQGYDSGDIKGHVYDDVSAALEAWQSADDQKVYIYSSGSVQAQKLLFGQSLSGDLLKYIDGHFDTAVGAKQEAASYTNIVEKIGCKADEILFLTDIVKEAEAARSAGMHAALVSRDGNAPLSAEAAQSFPVLRSLADLTVSNKRKPDPQVEEETPAKVPKTETENEVNTTPEADAPAASPKEKSKTEKMEVEDDTTSKETKNVPIKEQVTVEEITDSNDAPSVASIVDIEPMVEETMEEKNEKTEDKKTEMPKADEEKKEVEAKKPEETPAAPAVITEIEDITEKQLPDVAEIMDDIEPVVEEPDTAEDMEELQNAGESLEKECDDILAKVHDVTNLDNIPVKPLLNSIAEETMETDNTDSNDIVDRILDTELDLEMKKCTDIDLNTVSEITEEVKTDVTNGANEASPKEINDVPEVKKPEKIEVATVTERKADASTSVDAKSEETKVEEKNISETGKKEKNVEEISKEAPAKPIENKVEEEVKIADETVIEEVKPETETATKEKQKEDIVATPAAEEAKPILEEVKPTEQAPENGTSEIEPQVNGTNGDAVTDNVNGDASKEEALSSRLSVENGKINGSNGDAKEAEQGQGDCKAEAEVADIKVKTVPTEEPHSDPIEQPTEA